MKKLFFLTAACLFVCHAAFSQTRIKANMLYWALGMPNASVETRLTDRLTFNSDLTYSPWKSLDGNHFEFLKIIPEIRFYTKNAFSGFYVGAYGSFQFFNITKWNYWNSGKYQRGRGFALGASVGYTYAIDEKLGLDVYLGGGWQNSQYRGYEKNGKQYVGWNGSGEWLPYKVGISLSYKL